MVRGRREASSTVEELQIALAAQQIVRINQTLIDVCKSVVGVGVLLRAQLSSNPTILCRYQKRVSVRLWNIRGALLVWWEEGKEPLVVGTTS